MAKLREKADDENNKFEERMKIIQNNHTKVANDLNALNAKIDKYNETMDELASKYICRHNCIYFALYAQ